MESADDRRADPARMKTDDALLEARDTPPLQTLQADYRKCGRPADGFDRYRDADNIRFCKWANQHRDGKKHDLPDRPAFPFAGASDNRPMTADGVINILKDVCTGAFWRALTRPKAADDEAGQFAVTLADHLINEELYGQLASEVELSAQYIQHYGWTVVHPCWEQRISIKRQTVTIEDLAALAAQMASDPANPPAAAVIAAILDPAQEEQALQYLRFLYDIYAQQTLAGELEAEIPPVSDKALKRALRDLQVNRRAVVPVPYLCVNRPAVYALRPYEEVLVNEDVTDLQDAPVVFQREWVPKAKLRERELTEGYAKAWVDEAEKLAGRETQSATATVRGSIQSGTEITAPEGMVEVVHATYRAIDEDGVPIIYCTTFHPEITGNAQQPLYAKHEVIDYPHGEYPYVPGTREKWCRSLTSSRGVPEVIATWQNEEKALRDGIIDHTSIGVLPPVNVYKTPWDTKYRFGPAVQNLVMPGKEPQFMQVPTQGVPIALEAERRIERRTATYFGVPHAEVAPEIVQVRQAGMVQRFLLMWSQAIQQLVTLCQRYMSDRDFARITGAQEGWLEKNRDRMGALSVELHFDVRELNEELTLKRIEAVNKGILPTDAQGVIPRAKWVQLQLRAVNPTWAKELVMPVAEASDQLYTMVREDVAQMFLGNAPKLVENDPTAAGKLQFAAQIVQANPNYMAAIQSGGRFAELMKSYTENLAFSVTQERNKQIGRVGVDPAQMQEAGA